MQLSRRRRPTSEQIGDSRAGCIVPTKCGDEMVREVSATLLGQVCGDWFRELGRSRLSLVGVLGLLVPGLGKSAVDEVNQ
ncbi:hypothetical protein G9P44_003488 [Scheffersomyces stipitis]|nr:hypothetical protein G9P44_003488 [Scheffersomyces stipitis]